MMSRLCRLKTKSHGEDGLWAYQEITQLRAKVAELQSSHDALEAKLAKYENLEPVAEVLSLYPSESGSYMNVKALNVDPYNTWSFPQPGTKLYALEMK